MVAARFQRDVERRSRRTLAGDPQSLDFGVGLAKPPVPALADDLRSLGDHAADHRIRLDEPLPPGGKLQGTAKMPQIDFVLLHSDSGRGAKTTPMYTRPTPIAAGRGRLRPPIS